MKVCNLHALFLAWKCGGSPVIQVPGEFLPEGKHFHSTHASDDGDVAQFAAPEREEEEKKQIRSDLRYQRSTKKEGGCDKQELPLAVE